MNLHICTVWCAVVVGKRQKKKVSVEHMSYAAATTEHDVLKKIKVIVANGDVDSCISERH